ncbi:RNA-directed DNA polymerase (Reverse transcriptase) [Polaribacter litorisediminis]|uniref:reverse transcriptase domain-containing protein n=1 Tax=Polaribacter litorisediminis TaxID=1908341 RepID=UPI001CBFA355|nr:reverse transcriptase domain-containing protein [Polaribacter litorisediminis]UAM99383.1 RNA-directed DNA polymerase (Reverse transcriptase) [Polaribacter litorisediminis]
MINKKEKDWFKDRGYPHFSNKTPMSVREKVKYYVSNPTKVAKHSFLPLIFKEIKQRRYKESNFNGELKRSHKKLKEGDLVSNTKIRQILYATHIDAHVYSYYTQKIITPKYESYLNKNKLLSESITAYRRIETEDKVKFKNNVHFAKDVFDEIKKRVNCVALVLDIENFFPTLNHKKLKLAWAKIIGNKTLPKDHYNLFKAVTKFSYVKLDDLKTKNNHFDEKILAHHKKNGKHTFFDNIQELLESDIIIHKNQKKNEITKKLMGIPQGLPISALLANIYMLAFDEAVINELTIKHDVFYRRYSDDIVVLCKENEIEFVENFIIDEVAKIDLKISKEKTEKTLFKLQKNRLESFKIREDGSFQNNFPLNYLGFEFYGYQTLIKSKNLAQFYREMKQTVKRKHKRVEHIKEKYLEDEAPIFKRKLYRLYSFKGVKSRKLPAKRTDFIDGKAVTKNYKRKFRGNYLRYAYRASEDLNAPEIKRQLRNHWKILQKTIEKYDFSNVKKE